MISDIRKHKQANNPMKLPKSSNKNKPWLLPAIVISALVILTSGYLVYAYTQSNNGSNTKDPSLTDKQSDVKSSPNLSEGLPSNSDNTTSEDVPTDQSLSLSSVSFSQNNGEIHASAESNSAGTCVFTFKPGDNGRPITSEATVTENSCTTTLPENQFAFIGNWTLSITLYSNGKKTQVEQNVTIN